MRHRIADVEALQAGEYLECHSCHTEYDRADRYALTGDDNDARCPECGAGGFVLRGSRRSQAVAARRPMLSGLFYPSPVELRDHGAKLGLDFADRAVIEAIDSFPPGWDMTREDIAEKAGCSTSRVKRTLAKLQGYRGKDEPRGPVLIEVNERRYHGRVCGVSYDLTPLWTALSVLDSETVEEVQE